MAHRRMNVETGTEAAPFPKKEYINGIFVAVWYLTHISGCTLSALALFLAYWLRKKICRQYDQFGPIPGILLSNQIYFIISSDILSLYYFFAMFSSVFCKYFFRLRGTVNLQFTEYLFEYISTQFTPPPSIQ